MTQVEGLNENISPKLKKLISAPNEIRIELIMKGIWVKYDLEQELEKFLESLDKQPKRPRMMGRTIIGPTNNGKTSIIKQFITNQKKKQGNKETNNYEYLYVLAPTTPSVKSLYIRILSACNFPIGAGTAEQLWQKVLQGLRDLNVRMVFIDEIHNLLAAQNERIITQCRNVLKDLSNNLQIPIILIGTEEASKVLKGDPQVLNRFPIVNLERWKNDRTFRKLLNSFEMGLLLKKSSNLSGGKIRDRIYDLSEGLLGNVAIIITEASLEAIKSGEEKITLNIINKLHQSKFARF